MPDTTTRPRRRAELTTAQRRMLARLAEHNERYQAAQKELDALWRKRVPLYIAARELDPPLTYNQIAQVFGISEAAVMQMHKRGTTPPEADTPG